MIWAIRYYCIFETVTNTNKKRLEKRTETRRVCLELPTLCAHFGTLRTSKRYSNSSHVLRNCDSSAFSVDCEICYRSSRKDCSIAGSYTWSFTYPCKKQGVKSGCLGGQGIGPASPIQASSASYT
jgi:hypothetical protein